MANSAAVTEQLNRVEDVFTELYGEPPRAPNPFTAEEMAELDATEELLVHVPANISAAEMCERFGIQANVDFENERMIRSIMVKEDQWFLTSAKATPELINQSGVKARRVYEDEGLHGLDLRRYLAFAATYRHYNGTLPDQTYWTFLLSGSYDRSGVSVVGFDKHGALSHHGWMKNFRAKFCGSRYAVIAPRIELTPETVDLPRARRGDRARVGQEAGLDG